MAAKLVRDLGWAAEGLALSFPLAKPNYVRSTSKSCYISATVASMISMISMISISFADGAGKVQLSQLQNDDFDTTRGQHFDRGADGLGAAVEAVQLRHTKVSPSQIWPSILANSGCCILEIARHPLIRIPVLDPIAGRLNLTGVNSPGLLPLVAD